MIVPWRSLTDGVPERRDRLFRRCTGHFVRPDALFPSVRPSTPPFQERTACSDRAFILARGGGLLTNQCDGQRRARAQLHQRRRRQAGVQPQARDGGGRGRTVADGSGTRESVSSSIKRHLKLPRRGERTDFGRAIILTTFPYRFPVRPPGGALALGADGRSRARRARGRPAHTVVPRQV